MSSFDVTTGVRMEKVCAIKRTRFWKTIFIGMHVVVIGAVFIWFSSILGLSPEEVKLPFNF